MPQAVPALVRSTAIPRYLEHIHDAGIPPKVDGNYLKSVGFRSNDDVALIGLFKGLGFLDASGQPTVTYRQYRAASADEAKQVLGSAIKTLYAGLFSTYPDAYRKDDEALSNWIRGHSDGGPATQQRALLTFKRLSAAASFDAAEASLIEVPPIPESVSATQPAAVNRNGEGSHVRVHAAPGVTINVNLEVAATSDPTVYDQFFASMKKHLFPSES